jgi:hypothetical protein
VYDWVKCGVSVMRGNNAVAETFKRPKERSLSPHKCRIMSILMLKLSQNWEGSKPCFFVCTTQLSLE